MASGSKDSFDGADNPGESSDLREHLSDSSQETSLMGDEEDEEVRSLTRLLEHGFPSAGDKRSKRSNSSANTSSASLLDRSELNLSRGSMIRTIIEIKEKYAKATDGLASLRNMDRSLDKEFVALTGEVCAELDKLLIIQNSDEEDGEILDKEELAVHLKAESDVAELFNESLRKTSSAVVNPASFMKKLIEPTGDFLTSPFFKLPCVSQIVLLANRGLGGITLSPTQQEVAPARKEKAPLKRNSQGMIGEVEKESQLKSMDTKESELERIIDTAYFNNVNNALLNLYKSSKKPIEYWFFVMDPGSFSRTAKNMFDVSCLAQAGKLNMLVEFEENDGKQVKNVHLVPFKQSETEDQSNGAESIAISMKLTSTIYNEKKEILGSSVPKIPPVDEIKLSHSFFRSLKKKRTSS